MLTRELAIFTFEGRRIVPDRLTQSRHAQYREYAEQMLAIYRNGLGKTRSELHEAVHRLFDDESECPPQRIDAFCKLLDEDAVATYDTDRRGKAAGLRSTVFKLAAAKHPLVETRTVLFEHSEQEVKQEIARTLGEADWAEIERKLFSDVFDYNRLKTWAGYESPEALLSRYNVAQVQAALYNAVQLTIYAGADFRRIITHAKLARLLHQIKPAGKERYEIRLDGPASVLRETRRYGAAMAKFLPVLIACGDWKLRAECIVGKSQRHFQLELSSADGLKSNLPAGEEYDTKVEEKFAKKWGSKARNGWKMIREGGLLEKGQIVMVPDFSFRHEDGRTVWLEIVGFWTPEYLKEKVEKLKVFKEEPIIVAAAERVAEGFDYQSEHLIYYKTVVKLEPVLEALETI